MIGGNRQLVTYEPVEVHQDCKESTDHFEEFIEYIPIL